MGAKENLITGVVLGSGLMFLLDPQAGRRRRALVRDKTVRWSRATSNAVNTSWRRIEGTSRGVAATVRHLRYGEEEVDDQTLEARLRMCIGRHSAHPRAIDVSVSDGCVRLTGKVLASEVREVLSCASEIRGVRAVDNALEVHDQAGNIPELQGGRRMGWRRTGPNWRTAAAAAAGVGTFLLGRRVLGAAHMA
jgi:osmotically-inducible protein OsmY